MSTDIVLDVAMKGLIVGEDGRVLIVREADYEGGSQAGMYGLPGGKVNPGEKWQDALHREIKEETNLDVDIEYPIFVGEWRPVIKGITHQIIGVFHICRVRGELVIKLDHQGDHYTWVSQSDWEAYRYMKPDDQVIRRYFEGNVV